jgi:hypothetical protein
MPKNDPEIGPLIRGVFLAEEDEVAVSVDISQQEFRFVTHYGVFHKLPGARKRPNIATIPTPTFTSWSRT